MSVVCLIGQGVNVKGGSFQDMNKSLLLKVSKSVLLGLFALGYFLPFVVGKAMGADYSDSLWNVQDFATRLGSSSDSPLLLVVLALLVSVAAVVVFFYKESLSRYVHLAAVVVGLGVVLYVYYQVFIDKSAALEGVIGAGFVTMSLGLGVYLQIVFALLSVVLEFLGEKVFSFLK